MKNGFTLIEVIAAEPAEIYANWMDSEGHSAMTGSPAKVDAQTGGEFSAWDGYIFGRTLELKPDRLIVQAWRTAEFPESAPDSRVEILLEETDGGTQVTLTHSDMPDDQVESYRQGWDDFYFKPMKEYFGK